MLYAINRAVFAPLDVFQNNEMEGRLKASIATILTTAVLGSLLSPTINYFANKGRYVLSLDFGGICAGLIGSVMTWLAVCAMLWALAKAFHKDLRFKHVASIWGLSYIPNLLCVVLYGVLAIVPGIYSSSNILAAIFSVLFIVLLVWKAIFYYLFLRFVMETSASELIITMAVSAVVFVALILVGFTIGIQVPMI